MTKKQKLSSANQNCPHCGYSIGEKKLHAYHAGFSNLGFLYCDSCTNIFEFGTYNKNYVALVGNVHPWVLTDAGKRKVEEHLTPCPCGGRFRFSAYPKCPNCLQDISSLLIDKIHFVEIGDVIDGDFDGDYWLTKGT